MSDAVCRFREITVHYFRPEQTIPILTLRYYGDTIDAISACYSGKYAADIIDHPDDLRTFTNDGKPVAIEYLTAAENVSTGELAVFFAVKLSDDEYDNKAV